MSCRLDTVKFSFVNVHPARYNSHMTLPNFIIVGAGKSGTSSLARMLSHHPQVFIPPKELHFFDSDINYNRGPQFYSLFFAKAGDVIAIGEKTPKYTQHFNMPYIADRIYNVLGPNVKLIWILRDPVTRALSHYRHLLTADVADKEHVFRGLEPKTFHEVVLEELNGSVKPLLVSRGYYIDQVRIFRNRFSLKQMQFILFEEFIKHPVPRLRDLFSFLAVDPVFANRIAVERINASAARLPPPLWSFSSLHLALSAMRGRSRARHMLQRRLARKQIKDCLTNEPIETLSLLRRHFAPKNRRLTEEIGLIFPEPTTSIPETSNKSAWL